MIDKRHYKMMKAIQNTEILCKDMDEKQRSMCSYLYEQKYIQPIKSNHYNYEGKPDIFVTYPISYEITESGKVAMYEFEKDRNRWRIPLIISIFSAIGGYREELACIITTVGKLLKQ